MDHQPVPGAPLNLFGLGGGAPDGPAGPPVCSGKACRTAAVWVLVWNNPKLHTPDRRKTWLACEEHREHLSQFLSIRGFLKEVVTLEQWATAEAAGTEPARAEPAAAPDRPA